MLNGDELANKLFNALKDLDPLKSESDIPGTFERTVQKYLVDNMEATGTFVGTNPTSGATMTLNVSGTAIYPGFKFLPAVNGVAFHAQLSAAVLGGTFLYKSDDSLLVAPPAAFVGGAFMNLFSPVYDVENSSPIDYMKDYCNKIVSQIKSNFKLAPTQGTYNAFVGPITFISFK